MTTHQPIDVAIIGGGPAGYAAAIYAARSNLTTTVIEQGMSGGQIATTNEVENYPGIPLLSGAELGERFQQHAEGLGAQVTWSMVTGIDYDADAALFTVHHDMGDTLASSVIACMGATPRTAGFAGEDTYRGRGVSYCATCDGMFFRGKQVFVIGGGNVENLSILHARELLKAGHGDIRDYKLHRSDTDDIGMVCGGDVTAHFQFIPAEDPLWNDTASQALALLEQHTAGWLVLAEDGSAPVLLDKETVAAGSLPEDIAQALRTPGFSMAAGYISLPLPIGQRALLFGAGHISQALCPLLTTVDFRPVVFDDRPELANTSLFPTAEQVICGDFTRISDYLTVTEEDFVVIMTSGHMRDFQVEDQVLRGAFAYVGVIGSRRKTASVNQRLREAGIPEEAIALVHTPIGTPILAVTPEEIAVSIAGEMIQVRAQRRGPTPHGCPMHG